MNNVLVVYKKSTFELYGSSPDENTKQYVQKNYDSLKASHDSQNKTLEFVVNDLNNRGIKNEVFYRAHLGELSGELKKLEGYDLVISIGGDGTLLELSHYINETPVLGVNSDSGGSFGYFSVANLENFGYIMDNIYNIKRTKLNRLEIMLNGEVLPEFVLNDVLIAHSSPAASTRFKLYDNEKHEVFRKNSGILISTAAGSTAFMYEENGDVQPLDFDGLMYHIRSNRKEHDVFRFTDKLEIESDTRDAKLWIDGDHVEYNFTLGYKAKIYKGATMELVGDLQEKRKYFK